MTTLTMRNKKRLDVKQRVFRSYLTVEQAAVVGGVKRAAVLPDQSAGQQGWS